MWRVYRGLTVGRALARFALPFLFGAGFVYGGIRGLEDRAAPGIVAVLVSGVAIAGFAAFGLARGIRNAGRSEEAIRAEEEGRFFHRTVVKRVAIEPHDGGYRAPGRLSDEALTPIALDDLPLPKGTTSAGEMLAFRLTRTESRRHEIARQIVILSMLGVVSGAFASTTTFVGFSPFAVVAVVLAAIAAWTLVSTMRKARAFRTPEPIVEIDREPARLGEALRVSVVQRGPAPRGTLEIALRCEEVAVVGRGRSESTHRETIADVAVGTSPIEEIREGTYKAIEGSVVLPHAPASFFVRGAMIEWTVVVRLRRSDNDPTEDRYRLRVVPRTANEAS